MTPTGYALIALVVVFIVHSMRKDGCQQRIELAYREGSRQSLDGFKLGMTVAQAEYDKLRSELKARERGE